MLFTIDSWTFLLKCVALVICSNLWCRFIKVKHNYIKIFLVFSVPAILIWYQYQDSFLLKILEFGAFFFLLLYLKQEEAYCDVDINNCQRDFESIGAFWAHQAFDAYYKIMLSNLEERISLFEKEKGVTLSVKKLFVVCPLSCNVDNIFSKKDGNIKLFGNLTAVECDQGANINRKYFSSVYRIYPNEDIYITAQYPSPLSTLWKCESIIEKYKWIYHRDCFIKTLKKLLKDSPCIVLEWDDTADDPLALNSFLLSAVEEERYFQKVK